MAEPDAADASSTQSPAPALPAAPATAEATEAAWLGGSALVPALVTTPLVGSLLFARRLPTDAPDAVTAAIATCALFVLFVVPVLAAAALWQAWRWSRRGAARPGDRAKAAFGALAATVAVLVSLAAWLALPVYFSVLE